MASCNLYSELASLLLPTSPEEESLSTTHETTSQTKCISISRPGGMEQLRLVALHPGICTIGYNVKHVSPPPYTSPDFNLPSDCVIIKNEAISVNYAHCTIRWGLYESAKKFVGWPIVPGFDVAGTVERISDAQKNEDHHRHVLNVGDRVFGCSLFGAYSNPIVPSRKLFVVTLFQKQLG